MSPERPKQYDVVIFGATGYTGKYVVEELANYVHKSKKNIKWAVAGRSREKLKAALKSVQEYVNTDILNTEILVADVNDANSITEMCKTTKLLLNCVGPYKLYGEQVVAACVENGTHHVDISGEMKYLEETQAKYFRKAQDKGVYVVQSCGFDSIPADLGVALLKDKFPGDLNSVESYVQLIQGSEGRVMNTGTWMSAVHSVTDHLNPNKYMKLLKEKVFTKEMPKNNYPLKWRSPFFYSDIIKAWCFPFLGPDERVVKRSQMLDFEFLNRRPVEFKTYFGLESFFVSLLFVIFIAIFGFLSLFSFGRYLLGKFPSFFSAGTFSSEGPTRKQVEQNSAKLTLCGKGWSNKLSDPLQMHTEQPTVKMDLVITGPEPAYAWTSINMVYAGLVILEDSEKMPLKGGVLTPGVAFSKTTLCKRLEERGVTFEFKQ